MEYICFETVSGKQTRAFGTYLADFMAAGDFVALEGDMGAGKTCLTQGLAEGLGYGGQVTSPTFMLLHLYEGGRLSLYHFDAYRLASPSELEGLGYEEYFYGDAVCVMEWSELVEAYLPERRICVKLEKVTGTSDQADTTANERRRITVTLCGADERWADVTEKMRIYADSGD